MSRLAYALCLALSAAACSAVVDGPDPAALPRTSVVYVVGRDWHTEIGLRAEDVAGPLAAIRERFPGVRTLLFGFGDRQYLIDRRPGFGDMVIAAFPGPGALLVTGLRTTPEEAFGAADVVEVRLSDAGLRRVSGFLWNSFETDGNGRPLPIGAGPYPGSLFYASGDTYALTHTCNTWTAEALQTGGADVRAEGVLLAGQVMERARAAAALPGAGGVPVRTAVRTPMPERERQEH
jgi:hypothetical protein